jgi:osmoprotectant transport system ATP-binding protein
VNITDGAAVVPAIRLEHVTKTYPGSDAPAVDALDLSVPSGELVAMVGPSGCGKTTILKMVNRLIAPTSGRIIIDGVDAATLPEHELRRGIGYVIQQVGLFPHRTIRDNIATVPSLLGWDKQRTRARVDELCDLVGLDPSLLRRYPSALSGGQQQRVGVARALAADPPVLLMDEPYSAVDPVVRARLQDDLIDLQRRLHKTILLVTHDIDEAIKLADRVALLNVGGVLEQYGPPDELLRAPASAFVEGFLGNDRALKRLSRLTVADLADDALDPASANGRGEPLPAGVTLRDALDALLGSESGHLGVLDDEGQVRGTISVDVIGERLR